MVEILNDRKYYVKHLSKMILKFFSGSSSTTNEPKFKIMCNCIRELLNLFENPTQHIHTIRPPLSEYRSYWYSILYTS